MAHPFFSLLPLVAKAGTERDLIALVLRNTPGANVDPDDIRTVQAAMAWWRKFGGEQSFEAYLEFIPQAPDFVALRVEFPDFDLPVLVDPRLGSSRAAELAGLEFAKFGCTNEMLSPADARHRMPQMPYWVLAHDGGPNLGRSAVDCFADCGAGRLLAGTADMLVAIWLQYGPRQHEMVGPGSRSYWPESCASVNSQEPNLGVLCPLGAARHDRGSVACVLG